MPSFRVSIFPNIAPFFTFIGSCSYFLFIVVSAFAADNSESEYYKDFVEGFVEYEGEIERTPEAIVFGTKRISGARFNLDGKFHYQKQRSGVSVSGEAIGKIFKSVDGKFVTTLNEIWGGEGSCSLGANLDFPNFCKTLKHKNFDHLNGVKIEAKWKNENSSLSPVFKSSYGENLNTEQLGFVASLKMLAPPVGFGKKYVVGDDIYSGVDFGSKNMPWRNLEGIVAGRLNYGGREAVKIEFDGKHSKDLLSQYIKGYGLLDIESGAYLLLSVLAYDGKENFRYGSIITVDVAISDF